MLQLLVALVVILICSADARADGNEDCRRAIVTHVDIEIVIQGCTELLKADPNNAVAHYNRGVAHVRKNRDDTLRRAVADFDMAIALDPKFETHMARGGLYRWFHDFDRAIDDFTRAVQLDPKSVIAYRKRGEAYEARGTNWRAPASKRYITEHDGEQLMRDRIEAQHKGLELAAADYTKALEIEPNDVDTYWLRGKAAGAKHDHDQIISDWTRVIELDPQYRTHAIHSGLAHAYAGKGDFDKAIAHHTKILELDPKRHLSLTYRAEAHLKAGRPTEALLDIERSLALRPDDTFTITIRAEIFEALGRTEEAIADYRKAAAAIKIPRSRATEALKRLGVTP